MRRLICCLVVLSFLWGASAFIMNSEAASDDDFTARQGFAMLAQIQEYYDQNGPITPEVLKAIALANGVDFGEKVYMHPSVNEKMLPAGIAGKLANDPLAPERKEDTVPVLEEILKEYSDLGDLIPRLIAYYIQALDSSLQGWTVLGIVGRTGSPDPENLYCFPEKCEPEPYEWQFQGTFYIAFGAIQGDTKWIGSGKCCTKAQWESGQSLKEYRDLLSPAAEGSKVSK